MAESKDTNSQLNGHELTWGAIIREGVVWLVIYVLWIGWETCPEVTYVHDSAYTKFWWSHLLPNAQNKGWAGLSYVSCVTGLNIAIVKLQHFLKSQEDVQKKWVKQAVKSAQNKVAEICVEELHVDLLHEMVEDKCSTFLEDINDEMMTHWAYWARWATRMTIIGLICLMFQYSAGILGFFMAGPVIATWILSRITRQRLFAKMQTVDDLIPEFKRILEKKSAEESKKLRDELKAESDKLNDESKSEGQTPISESKAEGTKLIDESKNPSPTNGNNGNKKKKK